MKNALSTRGSFAAAALFLACIMPSAVHAESAVDDARFWKDFGTGTPVMGRSFSLPTGLAPAPLVVRDLGGDGVEEAVIGSPPNGKPVVTVLRDDGSVVGAFNAFPERADGGVSVTVGDVDGDGQLDIVAMSGPGADAVIRVFDRFGTRRADIDDIVRSGRFNGGTLATGDIDGDGRYEIIVGSGSGEASTVMVYRARGTEFGTIILPGRRGHGAISVAAADIDGDMKDEVVAAYAEEAPGVVSIFGGTALAWIRDIEAIGGGFNGGLQIAAGDLDGDGRDEIAAVPTGDGGPHVHVIRGDGSIVSAFFSHDESLRGGTFLAIGGGSAGHPAELLAIPAVKAGSVRPYARKFIQVDVSEQRLRAYEYGKLVKTFLVSTGLNDTTPKGDFPIMAKPEFVHYAGRGYDLGWVQYNLRFYPHIYIHYAPWHNNFGRQMSHGCVNVNFASAKWVFGWADVGTVVSVVN